MIVIRAPKITERGNKTFLESVILFEDGCFEKWARQVGRVLKVPGYRRLYKRPENNHTLWFSVEREHGQYLCCERSDAFLAAILYFALLTGEDVKCEAPLTERLYYQLVYYLMPALCNERTGYRQINIISNVIKEHYKTEGEIGTGASGGVDSLNTIYIHTQNDVPESYKLTYLTCFNTGTFNQFWEDYLSGISLEEWNKKAGLEFRAKEKDGQKLATELGLQFLSVDTNLSDLYQGVFLNSHTYRNCAAVLALQGLWGIYYYASAGKPQGQEQASPEGAVVFYDELLLRSISTPTLTFYSGGSPYTRIEKIRMLLDYAAAKKYLNVCQYSKNCGQCGKCMGAMLTLDFLGGLKDFAHLFAGIDLYKGKRWRFLAWVLDEKESNLIARELYDYMKSHDLKFPPKSVIFHRLLFLRLWRAGYLARWGPKKKPRRFGKGGIKFDHSLRE